MCAGINDDIQAILTAVIARAPDWIRRDLLSSDGGERMAAEEALAAMIAAALGQASCGENQRPAA